MEHHRVPPMMSNGGHGGQQQQQGLRSLNPRAAVFVPRGFAPSVSMPYRPSPQSNGGGGIHLHYQNGGGGIPLHYQNGGGSIPLHYQNDASRQVMPNNSMNGQHPQQQPNPSTQHPNPAYQQQPSNGNGAQYEMDNEIEDYLALSYLKDYIHVISNKPALLTVNGLHEITNIVNSYLEEDDCVLELVVNQLVDQSILDMNFRYSGVKICMHFMSNIREVPAGSFENLLIKRIQRECSRKVAPNTQYSAEHMNGLAFFVGDLFSQTKSVLVGEALPNLLMNLLGSIPKFLDENCKCVNQVLKLCGSELDELFARKESKDFDNIIQKLSELLSRDIHDNVKEMIKNTLKARENNWVSQINQAPKWSSDVSSAAGKDGSSSSAAALVQQAERLSLGGHGNMPPGMQQPHSAHMYGDYNQFNNFNNYYDGDDFEAGTGVFYSGCDRSMRGYDFGNGDEDNQEICEDFENFLMNLPPQAQH